MGNPFKDNYHEIRAKAQAEANATAQAYPEYARKGGCQFGIEKHCFGYSYFRLPLPQNRQGHELRCEVVTPM